MKLKHALLGLAVILVAPTVSAQWSRTKSWGIGYVTSKLTKNNADLTSDYGFTTNIVKTYYLHNKPIAGFLKVGLDAKWIDINYIKYQQDPVSDPSLGKPDYPGFYPDYDDYDDEEEFDLGSHNLDIGIGVGPSLNFAPFYKSSNGLRDLRFGLYAHFTPSFSLLTLKGDEETNIYYGFNPVVNFGLNIQWKMVALGLEGRWGFPKYSGINEMFEDYIDEDLYDEVGDYLPSKTNSNSFTSASFRVFLRLCF